jgi:hypothetical protein
MQTALTHVLDELEHERTALLETIAGLDDAALERQGIIGAWSIKNCLAHLAGWESWVLGSLPTRLATGQVPEPLRSATADEDAWNAEQVARREELSPGAQIEALARTRAKLVAYLRQLGPAALVRRRPWPSWEDSLGDYILAAIRDHDREHLPDLRAARVLVTAEVDTT